MCGIFVLGLACGLDLSKEFPLQEIEVEGTRLLQKREILELVNLPDSTNLMALDLAKIGRRLETNPYIKRVHVFRKLPSTLYIDIVERVPVAYLSGPELVLLDGEGVVLPTPRQENPLELPVITGIGKIRLSYGQPVGLTHLYWAAQMLGHMQEHFKNDLYRRFSELHWDRKKGWVGHFTDLPFEVYFGRDNLSRKLLYLKGVFDYLQKKGQLAKIQYIDLRFREEVFVK